MGKCLLLKPNFCSWSQKIISEISYSNSPSFLVRTYIFLIGYFHYLHFKSFPLPWSPLLETPYPIPPPPIWGCSPTYPPSPTLLFQHPPYTGPSNLPGTKGLLSGCCQGWKAILCCMCTWIPPGTLPGWWFSLWKNWVVRSAYVVLPMGLQSLCAPLPGSLRLLGFSLCIHLPRSVSIDCGAPLKY